MNLLVRVFVFLNIIYQAFGFYPQRVYNELAQMIVKDEHGRLCEAWSLPSWFSLEEFATQYILEDKAYPHERGQVILEAGTWRRDIGYPILMHKRQEIYTCVNDLAKNYVIDGSSCMVKTSFDTRKKADIIERCSKCDVAAERFQKECLAEYALSKWEKGLLRSNIINSPELQKLVKEIVYGSYIWNSNTKKFPEYETYYEKVVSKVLGNLTVRRMVDDEFNSNEPAVLAIKCLIANTMKLMKATEADPKPYLDYYRSVLYPPKVEPITVRKVVVKKRVEKTEESSEYPEESEYSGDSEYSEYSESNEDSEYYEDEDSDDSRSKTRGRSLKDIIKKFTDKKSKSRRSRR